MKNEKILVLTFIIISLIVILIIFKQQTAVKTASENKLLEIEMVCIKENCFNVEVARTSGERERGLMNVEYMDNNNGMLFIFPETGKYNFWMKNTLIPLDIIWIDSNNTIVEVKDNFQPCKEEDCEIYYSKENALYVLEINGNLSNKYEINIGDKIIFL